MQVERKIIRIDPQSRQGVSQGLIRFEREKAGYCRMGSQKIAVLEPGQHVNLGTRAGAVQQLQQRCH